MGSIRRLPVRLQALLGPLGWGGLVVFCISRAGDLANLVSRFFLGRWLPSLEFGAIDPVYSVLGLLSVPISIVFQVATVSISRLRAQNKLGEFHGLVVDMARIAAVGSLLAVVGVFFLQHLILSRLHLESQSYVFFIAGLLILAWWEPLYGAIVQGCRKYALLLVPAILNPGLMLTLIFVFAYLLSLGLRGALLARLCAGCITALVMFVLLKSSFSQERKRYGDELQFMKSMLLPMTVFNLSMALLYNFDRLYVRNFLLADSAGYGAIVTLGSIPLYLIGPIVFVIFPLAAAQHVNGRDVSRFYCQAMSIAAGITVVSVVGFWLTAKILMQAWTSVFVPYAGCVWLYALAAGLHGMIQIIGSVEMARHRYMFLWSMSLPVIAMCGGIYAFRSTLTVPLVLMSICATRVVMLVGMWTTSSKTSAFSGSGSERRLFATTRSSRSGVPC